MSTSLHAVFKLVSGSVYFVINIFNNHGKKIQFFGSSQNSVSKKSIFGHLEVIFLKSRGWFFPVGTFEKQYFHEKMSSPAGLKKTFSISRKGINFGHFGLPGSTFKDDFLNVPAKFRKILGLCSGEGSKEHCVKFCVFCLQRGLGGGG